MICMSMSMFLESESVLDIAIANDDVSAVEKCLAGGAIITTKSLVKINSQMQRYHSLYDCILNCPYDVCLINSHSYENNKKIFWLLINHNLDIVTNDIEFIANCITEYDPYYIREIIKTGYNGTHSTAIDVFKKIVIATHISDLEILLNNGFSHHMQLVLLDCLECGNIYCIERFIIHGVNCYSVLNDIYKFVCRVISGSTRHFSFCQESIIDKILKNAYHINMLTEPILKYFLLKSIPRNFDIPIEMYVHILQLYMAMDYACSHKIKEMVMCTRGIPIADNQILPLVPANEYVD